MPQSRRYHRSQLPATERFNPKYGCDAQLLVDIRTFAINKSKKIADPDDMEILTNKPDGVTINMTKQRKPIKRGSRIAIVGKTTDDLFLVTQYPGEGNRTCKNLNKLSAGMVKKSWLSPHVEFCALQLKTHKNAKFISRWRRGINLEDEETEPCNYGVTNRASLKKHHKKNHKDHCNKNCICRKTQIPINKNHEVTSAELEKIARKHQVFLYLKAALEVTPKLTKQQQRKPPKHIKTLEELQEGVERTKEEVEQIKDRKKREEAIKNLETILKAKRSQSIRREKEAELGMPQVERGEFTSQQRIMEKWDEGKIILKEQKSLETWNDPSNFIEVEPMMERAHLPRASQDEEEECPECEKKFPDLQTLSDHYDENHDSSSEDEEEPQEKVKVVEKTMKEVEEVEALLKILKEDTKTKPTYTSNNRQVPSTASTPKARVTASKKRTRQINAGN